MITGKTTIDQGAANRFIKHAIAQAALQVQRPPGDTEAGPSQVRVPVKVTSKMEARAQYEKELLRKITEAKGKGPKKIRRKRVKKGEYTMADGTPAATPLEAVSNMLGEHAHSQFSKHVDYAELSKVYGNDESSADPSRATSVAPSVNQGGSPSRQDSPAVSGAHASPQPGNRP